MVRPDAFDVRYAINPWMDPSVPVDRARARAQWDALRAVYESLGHRVDVLEPLVGAPDMVYAANGGVVVGERAVGSRFARPERAAEAPAFTAWLTGSGWADVVDPGVALEGEGDAVVCASVVLVGSGFRSDPRAAAVVADALGVEVLPLRLVDPRYYHLDLAVWHLGDDRLAWYPPALDAASQALVRRRFPDAVEATGADAQALGLNGWSDGRHAVLPRGATRLMAALADRGLEVLGVDVSELARGGGGPKCCTWEMHAALRPAQETAARVEPPPRATVPVQARPAPVVEGAAPAGDRVAAPQPQPQPLPLPGTVPGTRSADLVELAHARAARTYAPLPVVLAHGQGAWVSDVEGRRYLDCLAGYSALNFGHGHPVLTGAAHHQLDRLTLVSRAFHAEGLAPFCDRLAALVGRERHAPVRVVPMNTGAEAVETALKVARKWGYDVRGVPADAASVVVMAGGFHGRTTTVVGFSTDPDARDGFGPFGPGFRVVPYGDLDAVREAVDETTVAVLVEPVQGEAGVVVPPEDFLPGLRQLCDERSVLLVADEVQSGLGRTGSTLAVDLVRVRPDLVVLGKALGGGVVPVSAVVGRADVVDVLTPGTHGSTFGGNPLACAVGTAVVGLLETGEPQARAAALGEVLRTRLEALVGHGLTAVRTRGLWAGVDVDPAAGSGKAVCARMAERGVLAKDTHGSTLRLAPPLVVEPDDLHHAVDVLEASLP